MTDQQLMWAIRNAIRAGDTTQALQLIESDESQLQAVTPFGTWLHVASAFGNMELVKYLVKKGVDINKNSGILGGAPINEAASKGHLDVVRYLLSYGALLDTSNSQYNPLFSAIYGGHAQIVNLLLEEGMDATVKYTGKRMKDMDALAFAKERGQTEIAKVIATHLQR